MLSVTNKGRLCSGIHSIHSTEVENSFMKLNYYNPLVANKFAIIAFKLYKSSLKLCRKTYKTQCLQCAPHYLKLKKSRVLSNRYIYLFRRILRINIQVSLG